MSTPITDPEILDFIAEVGRFYPEDAHDLPMAEQRRRYDAMAAHFRAKRPEGLAVADGRLAGRPCRIYGSESAVRVLFLHGGGFCLGGLDSHDDVAVEIAVETGCQVTALDYRLAPEHRHPAGFEDALSAAMAMTGPLILCGDSAGGMLAAAVAWALRGEERLRGQVLIYPALGGLAHDLPSYRREAEAPLLTTAEVMACQEIRAGGTLPQNDPSFAPLLAEDWSGIAPAFLSAAEIDPLADDAGAYAANLRAAGGRGEAVIEAGLPHMWLRARHRSRRAEAAFARILEAIRLFAKR
ncbi:MAG: alpha/beta hydrolase [Pseudomonadota bacterium]